jgi:hypothetical protein
MLLHHNCARIIQQDLFDRKPDPAVPDQPYIQGIAGSRRHWAPHNTLPARYSVASTSVVPRRIRRAVDLPISFRSLYNATLLTEYFALWTDEERSRLWRDTRPGH